MARLTDIHKTWSFIPVTYNLTIIVTNQLVKKTGHLADLVLITIQR